MILELNFSISMNLKIVRQPGYFIF